jgi:fatty acid desaturase
MTAKAEPHVSALEVRYCDIHRRLNSAYPDAPQWWFAALFLLAFAMAFGALTVYVPEAPKWVLALRFLILTFSCFSSHLVSFSSSFFRWA